MGMGQVVLGARVGPATSTMHMCEYVRVCARGDDNCMRVWE